MGHWLLFNRVARGMTGDCLDKAAKRYSGTSQHTPSKQTRQTAQAQHAARLASAGHGLLRLTLAPTSTTSRRSPLGPRQPALSSVCHAYVYMGSNTRLTPAERGDKPPHHGRLLDARCMCRPATELAQASCKTRSAPRQQHGCCRTRWHSHMCADTSMSFWPSVNAMK